MYYHIRYLNIIIIICMISFPSAFIFFANAVPSKKVSVARKNAITTCIVYGILSAIVYGLRYLKHVNLSISIYIVVGVVAGVIIIFLELLLAELKIKKEHGEFTKFIDPPKAYIEKLSILSMILIVFAAGMEELLFRQIIIRELMFNHRISGIVAGVLISSCLYAINHIYFSNFTVLQKFFSGLIFSLLFVVSGYNLLTCVVAHSTQNILLYLFGANTYKRRAKK